MTQTTPITKKEVFDLLEKLPSILTEREMLVLKFAAIAREEDMPND